MTDGNADVRVLVILNRLFEWSQNFITRELVEMKRQGIGLYVGARQIVSRDDLDTAEKGIAQNFIEIPENPFLPGALFRHLKTALRSPLNYFRALQLFFQFKHTSLKALGRSLICFGRAASISAKVVENQTDLIHAHFMNAPADTAAYLSRLTGIPFGCTGHAKDIYIDNSGLGAKIAEARYMTTCTQQNVRFLSQMFPEQLDKFLCVYHGAPALKAGRLSQRNGELNFVAVGRFVPKKGFTYLIEACRYLKARTAGFKCRIVGEGPLRRDFERLITTHELENCVELTGYIPPNEMEHLYRISDVLVVPSVIDAEGDQDGLPNVCLEAMAAGLPVIASDVAALPEGVINGENGRLVAPGDTAALAGAMTDLLSANSITEMGKASRRIVREKFDLSRNVSRLVALMKQHAGS